MPTPSVGPRPPTSPSSPVGPIRLTAADFAKITAGSQAFMDKAERDNREALATAGVGLWYGAKSAFAKLTPEAKTRFVQQAVARKQPDKAKDPAYIASLIARMQPTSCIGYAMKAVGAGYQAAGKGDRWAEIRQIVQREGTIGTTLARELQNDGWEAVYWSADSTGYHGPMPAASSKMYQPVKDQLNVFDARYIDRRTGAFKPAVDTLGKPIAGRDYYKLNPRYGLLNFRPDGKPADVSILKQLDRVPLFVGVAESGYHTIIGQGQTLRDSHLMRNPDDASNIERRRFDDITWEYDLDTKKNKPESSIEQSGVIMVPPGSFGQ